MSLKIFASISNYFFVNLYTITIWTVKIAKDYNQLPNVFLYDLIPLIASKWCLPLNCVTVVKAANSDKQLNKKIANEVQTGFYATTTCLLFILEPVPNIQVWSDVNSVPLRLRNALMYLCIYTIYTYQCCNWGVKRMLKVWILRTSTIISSLHILSGAYYIIN